MKKEKKIVAIGDFLKKVNDCGHWSFFEEREAKKWGSRANTEDTERQKVKNKREPLRGRSNFYAFGYT